MVDLNWFKSTHDRNGFLEFDSNWLMAQKNFPEFWFKSTHDSKGFPKFWFISTQLKNLPGIFIWINSWLNYTIMFGPLSHWCWIDDPFWARPIQFDLVLPFLGFWLKCLSEKLIWINSWLKQYLGKLNQFNSWLKQLSRELTQNWLTTRSDAHLLIQINSRLKRLSSELTKIQLMTHQIPRYWFKSTHDSSKKHLILSWLMIQLLSHTNVCI